MLKEKDECEMRVKDWEFSNIMLRARAELESRKGVLLEMITLYI